jgi:hypothetical protein
MIQWNPWNPNTAGTKQIGLLLYLHDTVEHLKPDYGWDQRNRSVIIDTWYSGTSETRLRLGPKTSVCYYIYMIQWNLWNPTTAGTKEIGLLLYLHDTVEPLKPDYGWDQRNRSVIIVTWYSGTFQTRLRLGPKKSVCYNIYMIQWNLWNPTTAGTKQIGLLLYLHDTVEPFKPDYRWDQRNRSVIISTWCSGTSETRLRLGPTKSVC